MGILRARTGAHRVYIVFILIRHDGFDDSWPGCLILITLDEAEPQTVPV